MIEAANSDGNVDKNEIKKIKEALINIFKESPDDVDITLDKAIKNKNNSKSLYFYTSKINKEYTEEKKYYSLKHFGELLFLTVKFMIMNQV